VFGTCIVECVAWSSMRSSSFLSTSRAVRNCAVVGVLMVKRGRRVKVCASVFALAALASVATIGRARSALVSPDAPTDRRSRAALQLPRRRVLLALRLRCGVDRQPRGRIPGRCNKCPRAGCLASLSETGLCSWMQFSTTRICEDVSATQNARTVLVMSGAWSRQRAMKPRINCYRASHCADWNTRISASWFPRCGTARNNLFISAEKNEVRAPPRVGIRSRDW
jgi:hypothetical protein